MSSSQSLPPVPVDPVGPVGPVGSTAPSGPAAPSVLVVGLGVSGLAAARALREAGVRVRVVDRGRVVGGRLATRRMDDRPVDIGARYFTVPEGAEFGSVVDEWMSRGLVREWTDTFEVIGVDGSRESKPGPMRYAAPGGLRSLAVDLAERLRADGVDVDQGVDVVSVRELAEAGASADSAPEAAARESGVEVDGAQYDRVVLAMPDPQARRMLGAGSSALQSLGGADGWEPTISVVAAWNERPWGEGFPGAFIDGSPVVAFVADDGDRRGDGAAVLVAHTTGEFARRHLDHPESAVAPVVQAVRELLGIDSEPTSTHAHRWTFSAPSAQHDAEFLLIGNVGVCGDAWGERSAVGTAWASGTALGRRLAAELSGNEQSRSFSRVV